MNGFEDVCFEVHDCFVGCFSWNEAHFCLHSSRILCELTYLFTFEEMGFYFCNLPKPLVLLLSDMKTAS